MRQSRRALPPDLAHFMLRNVLREAPRRQAAGESRKSTCHPERVPLDPTPPERWPSGRRHTPAKGADRERSRGFESLPLRHCPPKPLNCQKSSLCGAFSHQSGDGTGDEITWRTGQGTFPKSKDASPSVLRCRGHCAESSLRAVPVLGWAPALQTHAFGTEPEMNGEHRRGSGLGKQSHHH